MVRQRSKVTATSKFGKFLKSRMRECGIENEAELAEMTGLQYLTIRRLMKVDRGLRRNTVKALAKALEVDEVLVSEYSKGVYDTNCSKCWDCVNAVPDGQNGCSWSRYLKPVDGWTVTKGERSYRVMDCPAFKEG